MSNSYNSYQKIGLKKFKNTFKIQDLQLSKIILLIPIGGPRSRSKFSNMLSQRRITICAVIFGLFSGELVSCDKEQSRNAALNEPDFEIRKPIQVPFSYFYYHVIRIRVYLYSYRLSCEIIYHSIGVYQLCIKN